MFLLKFIIAFFAIVSSLLFVGNILTALNNPQIKVDENGKAYDATLNSRVWLGLALSFFWAIFLAL